MEKDIELFVFSEAVPVDSPERVKAKKLGIRSVSYFQALGELSKDYFVIAVCGTHGKSSTTAMAARVLMDTGKDPTVVVGTKMSELGGRNWRKGGSDIFLVEACEYRKSFHFISPDIVLMTNVDGDHFDAFDSIEEYREAFVEFLKRLPVDGPVITHGSDNDCMKVAIKSQKIIIDADAFSLVSLQTPGEHMRQNARLVSALASSLKIDESAAVQSLSGFTGTWRRMEVKGTMQNGAIVIDDYGHHPVEIRATLGAIKEKYPHRRIVCVFQPHTHDRTRVLYKEFTEAFTNADVVIIPNIYVARSDIEKGSVDVSQFVNDIRKESRVDALCGHDFTAFEAILRETVVRADDVVITMGAGDITALSDRLLR